jgi:hypothetical protein
MVGQCRRDQSVSAVSLGIIYLFRYSKLTAANLQMMSALHPKADMCGATAHVCFGLKADIGKFIPGSGRLWQAGVQIETATAKARSRRDPTGEDGYN